MSYIICFKFFPSQGTPLGSFIDTVWVCINDYAPIKLWDIIPQFLRLFSQTAIVYNGNTSKTPILRTFWNIKATWTKYLLHAVPVLILPNIKPNNINQCTCNHSRCWLIWYADIRGKCRSVNVFDNGRKMTKMTIGQSRPFLRPYVNRI